MLKRSFIVFFILSLIIFFNQNVFAFKKDTKCQILKDAIEMCPEELRSFLRANFKEVHYGLHFTDRNKPTEALVIKHSPFFYTNLVSQLKEGNYKDSFTLRNFGLLASFIIESISRDNFFVASTMIPEQVKYDGFQEVEDPDERVRYLLEQYGRPYKGSARQDITDRLYNIAANEVVDQWVSIWNAAGMDTDGLKPDGFLISHKSMVLNFARYS